MDDLLELAIRLLDPLVQYIGPHAVAAVAVMGAVVTYINSQKQRRREKRLENKIDYLLKAGGYEWAAQSASSREETKLLTSPLTGMYRALGASVSTALTVTARLILRRVEGMQNVNWFMLTQGLLGALKLILQAQGIDVIEDDQINAIANGVASLMAIVGVALSNRKKGGKKLAQHPVDHGPAG